MEIYPDFMDKTTPQMDIVLAVVQNEGNKKQERYDLRKL